MQLRDCPNQAILRATSVPTPAQLVTKPELNVVLCRGHDLRNWVCYVFQCASRRKKGRRGEEGVRECVCVGREGRGRGGVLSRL